MKNDHQCYWAQNVMNDYHQYTSDKSIRAPLPPSETITAQ